METGHPAPKTAAPQARILIVDDEPTARATTQAFLLPEGYTILFAENGLEALEKMDELNPDVILLDVMMPHMSGYEVCQHLTTDKKWQHIPILLVTALDGRADLIQGLDVGATDFLSKPVNGAILRARVRAMLRLKRQHDELEAMLQLREDLAGMVAHDMRNPLTTMMGFSQLLQTRNLPPETIRNYAGKIHTQAVRLESFINDMLLMAKMEQGQLLLNCKEVDLKTIFEKVENDHQISTQAKNITLIVNKPDVSATGLLDENLFRRVLDNLISNALKFSPEDTIITIEATWPPPDGAPETWQYVRVQVIDEGPGIPEAKRRNIFEKFATSELNMTSGLQIGLGLAFCKMVTDAHHGTISVDANYPGGAIFTVEI